jgi:hypothetical protein
VGKQVLPGGVAATAAATRNPDAASTFVHVICKDDILLRILALLPEPVLPIVAVTCSHFARVREAAAPPAAAAAWPFAAAAWPMPRNTCAAHRARASWRPGLAWAPLLP